LQGVDISKTAPGAAALSAPAPAMNGVWGTIRSYILWQHERGTLHYDIMVTLILIFVFFSPRVIDAQGGLVYQISAGAITPGDDTSVRSQLLQILQPISGNVSIVSYQVVNDGKGQVQGYKVVAKRE
jgi:hypothetical protein